MKLKQKFQKTILCLGLSALSFSAHAVKVGATAPDFTLKAGDGTEVKLSAAKGKYVVLEWLNHGCPFVEETL
ncbi:MAG: redoxin domain-containing protein [Bdellovibrionota bacterium]